MPRYVALLRGINVGGNKKVPMAELRELLEGLGFTEVATLLQSGNAVFTAKRKVPEAKLQEQIERAIEAHFGFDVSVLLRTRDELAEVVAKNPMKGHAEQEPSRFVVVFLSGKADAKKLAALEVHATEELREHGRELYAWMPNGIGTSKLALAFTEKKLGAVPTARNWATVKKLLELADGR